VAQQFRGWRLQDLFVQLGRSGDRRDQTAVQRDGILRSRLKYLANNSSLPTLAGTIRTETLYDLLGRTTEQREPTFNASDARQAFTAAAQVIYDVGRSNKPYLSWTPLNDPTLKATVVVSLVSNPATSYTFTGSPNSVRGG